MKTHRSFLYLIFELKWEGIWEALRGVIGVSQKGLCWDDLKILIALALIHPSLMCVQILYLSLLYSVCWLFLRDTQRWEALVLLVCYFTAVVLRHGEVCMWRPDGEVGSLPQSWLLGFELQVDSHPRKGFSHWSTSRSLLTVSQTSLAVLKFYQLITLIPLLLKRDKKRV